VTYSETYSRGEKEPREVGVLDDGFGGLTGVKGNKGGSYLRWGRKGIGKRGPPQWLRRDTYRASLGRPSETRNKLFP